MPSAWSSRVDACSCTSSMVEVSTPMNRCRVLDAVVVSAARRHAASPACSTASNAARAPALPGDGQHAAHAVSASSAAAGEGRPCSPARWPSSSRLSCSVAGWRRPPGAPPSTANAVLGASIVSPVLHEQPGSPASTIAVVWSASAILSVRSHPLSAPFPVPPTLNSSSAVESSPCFLASQRRLCLLDGLAEPVHRLSGLPQLLRGDRLLGRLHLGAHVVAFVTRSPRPATSRPSPSPEPRLLPLQLLEASPARAAAGRSRPLRTAVAPLPRGRPGPRPPPAARSPAHVLRRRPAGRSAPAGGCSTCDAPREACSQARVGPACQSSAMAATAVASSSSRQRAAHWRFRASSKAVRSSLSIGHLWLGSRLRRRFRPAALVLRDGKVRLASEVLRKEKSPSALLHHQRPGARDRVHLAPRPQVLLRAEREDPAPASSSIVSSS